MTVRIHSIDSRFRALCAAGSALAQQTTTPITNVIVLFQETCHSIIISGPIQRAEQRGRPEVRTLSGTPTVND